MQGDTNGRVRVQKMILLSGRRYGMHAAASRVLGNLNAIGAWMGANQVVALGLVGSDRLIPTHSGWGCRRWDMQASLRVRLIRDQFHAEYMALAKSREATFMYLTRTRLAPMRRIGGHARRGPIGRAGVDVGSDESRPTMLHKWFY